MSSCFGKHTNILWGLAVGRIPNEISPTPQIHLMLNLAKPKTAAQLTRSEIANYLLLQQQLQF